MAELAGPLRVMKIAIQTAKMLSGEGVGLLEKGVGCTLPEEKQENGLSVGAGGPREHPDAETIGA